MGGKNQNKYTARFLYKDELLAFNRREKYIIPLVDYDEDDPMDDQRSQGAWNKAINGKPSPDELVEELEGLYESQRDDPASYLPEPPPDDPTHWMAQIATREWWADTLDLDKNQLVGWFTGRSKKLEGIVQERVANWYARLSKAATETSKWTNLRRIVGDKKAFLEYVLRLREDGDEMTDDQIKQMIAACFAEPEIIDWADPKPGYSELVFDATSASQRLYFQDARGWLDDAEADGWEGVRSSLPPDDVWEKLEADERQWSGAYADQYDLNRELYFKEYRVERRLGWNRDRRSYDMTDYRIVSVLEDGEWREPTEREAQGWDEGTQYFWAELRRERDGDRFEGGIRQR